MAANISASYDKIILVLAIVIALGLGATVFLNAGKIEEEFKAPGGGNYGVPKMGSTDRFKAVTAKIGTPVTLAGPITDGTKRPINNFVGTPLFLKAGNAEAIDLGDVTYPAVHPPIPNKWWLENRIDPGHSDSPGRDPDSDGFTNLDEFNGKTNPNDATSFPSLIAKLECAVLEKRLFKLTYSSDTSAGKLKPTDTYKFKYEEMIGGRRKSTSSDYMTAGKGAASNLFNEGGGQLRYEFKSVEQRMEVNPKTKIEETSNYALLEDVGSPKKGTQIELKKGTRNGVIITDYTAVLFLNAVGEADKQAKIPERSSFSLPFDPNAAKKPYTFTGVNGSGQALIEWQEGGETKTRELTPNSQP
jgi:hypothetical protein